MFLRNISNMENSINLLNLKKNGLITGSKNIQGNLPISPESEVIGSDKFILNELHRAIYEGDVDIICNHIDNIRVKARKALLTESEHYDVDLFYKNYLDQHPPDGILRMAQFMNAVLRHFA